MTGDPKLSAGDLGPLVLADQAERWRSGDRVLTEEYFQRYPQLLADRETCVDLVYSEFLYRTRAGEGPTIDEFRERFPQFAQELELQIQFHRAMESDDVSLLVETKFDKQSGATSNDADGSVLEPPGYEILQEIGRGGMGVVYKARHQALNRIVALKMLIGGAHAGASHVRRLLIEAQAAARLQHPNIVQIHEVGTYQGTPFLALEYVGGGTLAEYVDGNPIPPGSAAAAVETLARAVHYAHEQGIVHRDLKPGNILVNQAGGLHSQSRELFVTEHGCDGVQLKITDFSLAKVTGSDVPGSSAAATMTGDVLGTAPYMSPEQALGNVSELTVAVDVYALGAILYELITGRPPFVGTRPLDVLSQVISDEPVRPSRLIRRVPRDLQTICLKCLEKNPRRRYESARALADELQRFQANVPITARRISRIERAWRWCRRHPVTAILLTGLTIFTILVVFGTTLSSSLLRSQLRKTELANRAAFEQLWESYLSDAALRQISRQIGQRYAGLAAIAAAQDLRQSIPMTPDRVDRMRTAAIGCLVLPDLEYGDGWNDPDLRLGALVFGRTRYAFWDGDAICIREIGSGMKIGRISGVPGSNEKVPRIAFSPDDAMVAVVTDDCRVFRLDGPQPRQIYRGAGRGWWAFSPDSKTLVGASTHDELCQIDLSSHRVIRKLGSGVALSPIVFSPNEKLVAVATADSLRIVEIDTGTTRLRVEPPASYLALISLAWKPDGTVLAACPYDDSGIVLWDVETGSRVASIMEIADRICFSKSGEYLLAGTQWNVGRNILWNVNSQRTELVITHKLFVDVCPAEDRGFRGFTLTRDAKKLVTTSIQAPCGFRTLCRPRIKNDETRMALSFSPDARLLAASSDGAVHIYRTSDWSLLSSLTTGFCNCAFDSMGSLYTCGRSGLHRWMARYEDGIIRWGPPEKLRHGPVSTDFYVSEDGSAVVVPDRDGAVLLELNEPRRVIHLQPHRDVRSCAISRDGSLVATGGYWEGQAKIWERENGRLLRTLDVGKYCLVRFSPSGRSLMTGSGEFKLWDTDSWQSRTIDFPSSYFVFAPNEASLAVLGAHSNIDLIDIASDRRLVTLRNPPRQAMMGNIAASPDGRYLAVIGIQNDGAPCIWDLEALQVELHRLSLDWPTASSQADLSADLHPDKVSSLREDASIRGVQFVLDDEFKQLEAAEQVRRTRNAARANEIGAARIAIQRALQLDSKDAETCRELAWLLTTGPMTLRDPKSALRLARTALQTNSDDVHCRRTLGIALVRNGKHEQAIEILQDCLAAHVPADQVAVLFFLAISYAEIGKDDDALSAWERAHELYQVHRPYMAFDRIDQLDAIARESELFVRTPEQQP